MLDYVAGNPDHYEPILPEWIHLHAHLGDSFYFLIGLQSNPMRFMSHRLGMRPNRARTLSVTLYPVEFAYPYLMS